MKNIKTGDCVFVHGKGPVAFGIKLVTRSDYSHVGMVYNDKLIFETHVGQNARLNPINKDYVGKEVDVYRPDLTEKEREKVIQLCHKYNGAHYSVFDIGTNFIFSWLPPKARRWTVSKLGRKGWMICSEITARILYEVNSEKFSYLAGYEGLRPDGLLGIARDRRWKPVDIS